MTNYHNGPQLTTTGHNGPQLTTTGLNVGPPCTDHNGYAHPPFSPKFLMGLCSDGPSEYSGQI